MNVLWPIIVIIAGAIGVYACRALAAPKPFEIAVIVVVALALVWWLLVTFGGYTYLSPHPG